MQLGIGKLIMNTYTRGEEIWHSVLHGVGAMLAIAAIIVMSVKAVAHSNDLAVIACGVFGAGMIIMFVTSTIYHSAYGSPFQPFLKMLDHSAIYIMIATGYAPFALLVLPEETGKPIIIGSIIVAILGVVFKITVFILGRQHQYKWVSLSIYLLMGWAAVLVIKPLYELLSPAGFYWLLAGGLCYTVGAGFYAAKSMKYSHAIWHFFVVAGAACHFSSVYWYVL